LDIFVFFAKISIRGECVWHLEFMRWQTISGAAVLAG